MTDKSWLLNHAAIKAAKTCILLTQSELGVKLTLSHPDFFELLTSYVELTDNDALRQAFDELAKYADSSARSAAEPIAKAPEPQIANNDSGSETIIYKGKAYQRWNEGLEFKGLYRGQPRYA
ncbi:Uncharacterised protein [BD1-7 clade bacterium]|uniref:Uncharacterized protein n=1 Tax=BD1-7 clade bacterium TaxID=2029982 RepID=A0A5S9NMW0_9GAMM|nr:Uncharacterised protein [BD1-7 clade bacterium]CAA0093568.1 Uncharacterised protein [BD1-7 clade bacterium]